MNIQRNIFAGLLIFLVFLTIPFYLDFIGITTTNDNTVNEMPILLDSNIEDNKNTLSASNTLVKQPNKSQGEVKEEFITIHTDYYSMVLSNRAGGSIVEYQLTATNKNLMPKYVGSYDANTYNDSLMVNLINNPSAQSCTPCFGINGEKMNGMFTVQNLENSITLRKGQSRELVFTYPLNKDEYIEKRIIVNGDGFSYKSEYAYQLNDNQQHNLEIIWDNGILPTEPGEADIWEGHSSAYIYQNNSLESITQGDTINIEEQRFNDNINWFAIRNKYFGIVVVPDDHMDYAKLSSYNNDTFENRPITPIYTAILGDILNQPIGSNSFTTYIGPLDIDHIQLIGPNVEQIMNFGWSIIKPFSKMILWLIKSLHAIGLNYGFVLILLGFLMRIIMGPLTKKSAESSAKMQEMAPLQKQIQEKYKDNPQQLQKEMGALWKKHGVNPISGCLPMLLQWPILMSLFIVFRSTIEFRGQPFIFWINDLSQPDYIFSLPFDVPMYGSSVAVLPIIMGISMFLTMGITMQDKSQKPLMYFMNTFFILIFNTFPSALTLYYTVFNFLSYQQQLSIKKNK